MDGYRRAKAELKARSPAVAALKGDAYTGALSEYRREKQRLREVYLALRADSVSVARQVAMRAARGCGRHPRKSRM